MMTRLTRRRFISIAACATALPYAAHASTVAKWRGIAMGAYAQMQISGLTEVEATPLFARIEKEIARIEDIFSLYRTSSALVRLNKSGSLTAPPPELLELLSSCSALHAATGGAFDPTIQPLWQAYAQGGSVADIDAARSLTGWSNVNFSAARIEFAKPGMALTFNGVAQGYLADRVSAYLREFGMANVLVDMGEIVALGQRPDGGVWRAGIVEPGGVEPVARVELAGRALATSSPVGTYIRDNAGAGHIINPVTGKPADLWRLVSVSAERAAVADGLSTAFCLMNRDEMARALEVFGSARVEYLA